jgi:hypothetical protein
MLEIYIKRKIKFGKDVRILESKDLPSIQSFVRKHYGKQGGWIVTKPPEVSGIFKKYYRMEIMKRF